MICKALTFLKVHPSGEISNFLLEDYEAVLKFMNGGMQKKKSNNKTFKNREVRVEKEKSNPRHKTSGV